MKLPQKPPEFKALFTSLRKSGRLPAIMALAGAHQTDAHYYHWDELRRRPALPEMSHEEMWMALKLKRKAAYRPFPLNDCQGQPFQYSVPEQVLEILHEIDFKAGSLIGMPEPVANPHTRDRYIVNSLIQESITSSQLEGAATTREVAKEMLKSGRSPRNTSERMILNNYLAMQEIIRLREKSLTPDLVMELHRIVTDRTMDNPDASGRFRKADEEVRVMDDENQIVHRPPPAAKLPERLELMCDFANGRVPDHFVPPAIRAILLHFWLAYDHPFVDGNGRTARALFYWAMLNQGFWLFEFISISGILVKAPARYARAFLHTETDENDLNYFILYQADVIRRAIAELHDYLRRKQAEQAEAQHLLKAQRAFNHRQQALLVHSLKHPAHEYTVHSHRTSHGVAYATARADLLGLHQLGLLDLRKRGKAMAFSPAADLADRLKTPAPFAPNN